MTSIISVFKELEKAYESVLVYIFFTFNFFFYTLKFLTNCLIFLCSIFILAIKNALKQENLNPEVEEKLIKLQRYQEKQMKEDSSTVTTVLSTAATTTTGVGILTTPTTNSITLPRKRPLIQQQDSVQEHPTPEPPIKKKITKIEQKEIK